MMVEMVEQPDLAWPFALGKLPRIKNVMKRMFGCWHSNVSLPFTRGDETYQTCVSCGARRRFDLDQWASVGGFYYPKKHSALYGGRR